MSSVAKSMQRSFCVLTCMSWYDPKKDELLADYKNIRVLVGTQTGIDTLAAAMSQIKGSFEVMEQYIDVEQALKNKKDCAEGSS